MVPFSSTPPLSESLVHERTSSCSSKAVFLIIRSFLIDIYGEMNEFKNLIIAHLSGFCRALVNISFFAAVQVQSFGDSEEWHLNPLHRVPLSGLP